MYGSAAVQPGRLICIGLGRDVVVRISDAVNFFGCWLEAVSDLETASDRLASSHYDAGLLAYRRPQEETRGTLTALRAQTSPALRLPILLIARKSDISDASELLTAGATRVLDQDRAPHLLHLVLAEVVNVAPRVAVQAEVRLGPPAPFHGTFPAFAARPVVARTVNISSSGMLVSTARRDPPGSVIPFELDVPEEREPVRGWAEVIRVAAEKVEENGGLGLRIRTFSTECEHGTAPTWSGAPTAEPRRQSPPLSSSATPPASTTRTRTGMPWRTLEVTMQ